MTQDALHLADVAVIDTVPHASLGVVEKRRVV